MSKRLLIAVGEAAVSPDQIPSGIRLLIGEADEILVISPRLPSRLEWLASDTDKAKEEADERLREVLGQLDEMDASVEAAALGADDPLLAFQDAIARFSPDHILVGLRQEDRAGWQEKKLLQSLWDEVDIPLTVFVLSEA